MQERLNILMTRIGEDDLLCDHGIMREDAEEVLTNLEGHVGKALNQLRLRIQPGLVKADFWRTVQQARPSPRNPVTSSVSVSAQYA